MSHFDVGLALYSAMLRVSKGGSPGEEVRKFLETAPTTVSLRSRSRNALRVAVIESWDMGRSVEQISLSTGATKQFVYRIVRKMRKPQGLVT